MKKTLRNLTAWLLAAAMICTLFVPAVSAARDLDRPAHADAQSLSQGVVNIVKRARQMTSIRWTPLADIYGWDRGVTYRAGVTYVGLPYGQPVDASYVPWTTSLQGFSDAVKDPGSRMYTATATYNCVAPYYSTDCSAFVSWAWGRGSRCTTRDFPNFAQFISSTSYDQMEVGDCLNKAASHVVLVTDITYAANGTINGVEISEATVNPSNSYCALVTRYGAGGSKTMSDFYNRFFGDGYVLYRSKTRDSVTYTHCCAVPLEGDVCSLCGYGTSGPSDTVLRGIDVSHHQGAINWNTAASSIDFAVLRCGYGGNTTAYDDRQWKANADACTALGIPFGVYLYSYAESDEEALDEAQHVIRLLQGYSPTLPVYLDLEDPNTVGLQSNAAILRHTQIFCDAIAQAGYTPGVYASYSWWTTKLSSSAYNQWEHWIARWGSSSAGLTYDHYMWQYSDSGSVPGISGNVDMDYWYGPFPGRTCTHSYAVSGTVSPGCETPGSVTYTCTKCGASYSETIAPLGHSYGPWETQTPATCTSPGVERSSCIRCGSTQTRQTQPGPHSYTESYEAPDCQHYGATVYTCTVCGDTYRVPDDGFTPWSEEYPEGIDESRIQTAAQYRTSERETTQSSETTLPGWERVGSDWTLTGRYSVDYAASWPSGFDRSHSLFASYNHSPVSPYETETEKIVTEGTAVCGYIYWHWCRGSYAYGPINRKINDTKTSEFGAFHAFYSTVDPATLGDPTDSVNHANADCCKDTYWYFALPVTRQTYAAYRSVFTYSRWGQWSDWSLTPVVPTENRRVETRTVYRYATGQLGEHHWDEGTVLVPASCGVEGLMSYACEICGSTWLSVIPATVHEWDIWEGWTMPTCTEDGWRLLGCKNCGETVEDILPAYGHNWSEGTVILEPTFTSTGLRAYVCYRCSELRTEIIPALGFENPFVDVNVTDWFYAPVVWALQNGITSGISQDHFGPNQVCTRAQVVTFLWREAGKPTPRGTVSPFTDVRPADYYFQAVLWAVDQGITAGVGDGLFGADEPCIRSQVVTFLWRAANQPEPVTQVNPFPDVRETDYFYRAVLWAAENHITAGDGSGFSPLVPCTRSQVVTFLYRFSG